MKVKKPVRVQCPASMLTVTPKNGAVSAVSLLAASTPSLIPAPVAPQAPISGAPLPVNRKAGNT
jgi:hypothetical protein